MTVEEEKTHTGLSKVSLEREARGFEPRTDIPDLFILGCISNPLTPHVRRDILRLFFSVTDRITQNKEDNGGPRRRGPKDSPALKAPAEELGVSPLTIDKWRKVVDPKHGPGIGYAPGNDNTAAILAWLRTRAGDPQVGVDIAQELRDILLGDWELHHRRLMSYLDSLPQQNQKEATPES